MAMSVLSLCCHPTPQQRAKVDSRLADMGAAGAAGVKTTQTGNRRSNMWSSRHQHRIFFFLFFSPSLSSISTRQMRQHFPQYFKATNAVSGKVKSNLREFVKGKFDPLAAKDERPRKHVLKPYSQDKFADLVHRELNVPMALFSKDKDISAELVPIINKMDLRLMCNVLRLNGSELRDAHLATKTVEKLLAKDQVLKAIQVCKLAKQRGTVAMNKVMEYYVAQQNVEYALELFMWRKKWHIPNNERSFSILFNGFAKKRDRIGTKKMEFLTQQYEKLAKEYRSKSAAALDFNVIHINSFFSCLINASPEYMHENLWRYFKELPSSGPHSANPQTYSILLEGIIHNILSPEVANEKLRLVFEDFVSRCEHGSTCGLSGMKKLALDGILLSRFMQAAAMKGQDAEIKHKIYNLAIRSMDLTNYDFEPLDVPEHAYSHRGKKIYPTRPLLNNFLMLVCSLDANAAFSYLQKMIEANPKGVDAILVRNYFIKAQSPQDYEKVKQLYKASLEAHNSENVDQSLGEVFNDDLKRVVFVKYLQNAESRRQLAQNVQSVSVALFQRPFPCVGAENFISFLYVAEKAHMSHKQLLRYCLQFINEDEFWNHVSLSRSWKNHASAVISKTYRYVDKASAEHKKLRDLLFQFEMLL